MSGHLRWLAAQALGQSSGVRPVRLAPSFYDTPRSSGASPGAPGIPMEEPPPAGRAEARLTDRMRSAEPRDAPSAFARARTEPPGDAGTAATATATALAPEPERVDARAPRDGEHPVTIVQAGHGEAADDGGDARDGARAVVHEVIADPPRRQPTRPVPRETRLGRRGPERAEPEPAENAPLPPPDVHIHIGRVELTAIATPQPARREPAGTKKPMSLDEYLRRRGGREA